MGITSERSDECSTAEPDYCVCFAIADTLGKLASRAQKVGVIDAERGHSRLEG